MLDGATGDVVESDEQVKGYAIGWSRTMSWRMLRSRAATVDIEKFVPKVSPSTIATATCFITSRPRTRPARGLRDNPRCHEEKADGRHRPCGDGQARTHHDDGR